MGSFFSSASAGKKPVKILMTGLDAAGKTTMIYKLKVGENVQNYYSGPHVGFNIEEVRYQNLEIVAWDSGGRMKMGTLKKHYNRDTAGVIYFVDANDRERIDESAEELRKELSYVEHKRSTDEGVPVLVLANKMDLPNAMSVAEVTEKLDLHSMKNRQWYVQASCATMGEGIYEGLDWFTKQIERRCRGVTVACELSSN